MTKQVDFYYDYGSPTCYLAWTELRSICMKYSATLVRNPVLLGAIFKTAGNTTPVNIPAKKARMFKDIERYAGLHGVPFAMNPHFIFNTLPAMRGAIWASRNGGLERHDEAVFEAAWARQRNIGELDVLKAVLADAGLDAAAFSDAIQTDEVKKGVIDLRNQAIERGRSARQPCSWERRCTLVRTGCPGSNGPRLRDLSFCSRRKASFPPFVEAAVMISKPSEAVLQPILLWRQKRRSVRAVLAVRCIQDK